ncbi:hypothetical protein [Alicyclobacillus fodiniaquatilis]|uniref:Uncharacterized protein n=1 Tax=Alicyclobacillus fodiniaquatilis TaxID=1661150 RepID=A0ABW4JCY3_9BACL
MNLDLKSLIASLRPNDIKLYLRSKGWKCAFSYEHNLGSVWFFRSVNGEAEVILPEDPGLLDYNARILELLRNLEIVEDRSVSAIAYDISITGTDVLRFRIASSDVMSGSIPFMQASSLVRGVETMLLAAACATIQPKAYFPRMSYSEAKEYIQSCKMGQSERGSYIVTVMSPVTPALMTQSVLFPEYDVEDSFQRRVLYTLFNGLHHLRGALADGTSEAIEQTVAEGVSANLCEALTLMQPANEVGELEIGVSWSPVRPLKRNLQQAKIKFTKDIFPLIDETVKYLRQTAPLDGFELSGLVRKLDSSHAPLGGKVSILALMDEKPVNVSIDLSASAYQIAVQAHLSGAMLFCRGTLKKEGKGYRMEDVGDVRIDPNFQGD